MRRSSPAFAPLTAPLRSGSINPIWTVLLLAVVVGVVLTWMLQQLSTPHTPDLQPLRLYCAAGMRGPVERVVRQYRDEYGVPVEIQYGGSNTLLSQLQVNASEDADLFLAADDFYTDQAQELGLAREVFPLAYAVPVVAVQSGNPKGITTIRDLLRADVKVALADPDQAAVGKATRDRLQKVSGAQGTLWDELTGHVTRNGVFKATVNDIANDVKLGAVDAAIVWDFTLAQPAYRESTASVTLPELAGDPDRISLTVLKSSRHRPAALRFARYLAARDRGLQTFRDSGFQTVDGDVWEERPELTFYCGAVNRRVVEGIVADFMRDEGVVVNTVFDGCGILTSRMRTIDAQRVDLGFPDLYMACDKYYLDDIADVRQWFLDAAYVSEADLVLVVPKGNTRVTALADVVKPGVRFAIGQPEQCTIGVLSWQLLERAGLAGALREKLAKPEEVVVAKSSSAHLVPDVITGHVDAAIAYVTDTLTSRDRVDVLPLDVPDSKAVQPITIARSSPHKYLARRLFARIGESREAFERAGFRYRGLGGSQTGAAE